MFQEETIKTKERNYTMEIITTYKADDGTLFENENDCFNYEKSQEWAEYKDRIKFFDRNKNRLETSFTVFDSGAVYFMTFFDDESADFFSKQEFDCYSPFDKYDRLTPVAGMYWFNENKDKWINIDEEIEWYISLKDKLYF